MKNEVKNGIVVSVCVILILLIVYFSTAIFLTGEIGSNNNKSSGDSNKTEQSESSVSDYSNMIIAGKTFNQKEDNYMVLFFSGKEISDNLKNAITKYDSRSDVVKLYKVNIDEAINKYVKNDVGNSSPTNNNDLRISGNTLITISSGNVSSYVNDESQIINILK